MDTNQLKDDFLSGLLKPSMDEKPGSNFTVKIMRDIEQLEADKARSPIWNSFNIIVAIAGLIALVLLYFAVSPFLDNLGIFGQGIDAERFNNYFAFILDSFKGFLSLVEFFRESTISLVILFVIPALVLLDFMLKRLSSRTLLFLF